MPASGLGGDMHGRAADDASTPSRRRRLPAVLDDARGQTPGLVLGVVVGLVLGLVLGLVGGVLGARLVAGRDRDTAGTATRVSAGTVSVGAVREADDAVPGDFDFVLPVHNGGRALMDATIVSFQDMTAALRVHERIGVPPGSWILVPFSARPTCDTFLPSDYSSVRVGVRTPRGRSEVVVPLPGEGAALVQYHHVLCDSARVVTRRELLGVWVVSRVFGADTGLVGVHLVRFGRDGLATADPEGGLFTANVGVRSRYRLADEVLTTSVTGGYACEPGSSARWRPEEGAEPGTLTLVWLSGTCPTGERGDFWILRRVLDDAGLPPTVTKLRPAS